MSIPIAAIGFAPIVEIGFAPSVHINRISFTSVDRISFTLGFVFVKKISMTNLTVACNCSMPRTMATWRTFLTWPVIFGSYVSIAQIQVERTVKYDPYHTCR
jgi:hypothetical protein